MKVATETVLQRAEWQAQARTHRARARKWTEPYRKRRASGRLHPIVDFLFIYYRFTPGQLELWHPGVGRCLEIGEGDDDFDERFYRRDDGLVWLDPEKISAAASHRMEMALQLLRAIDSRPAQFGCFGLHEWAMVYRGEARHSEQLPLRLKQSEIDALVESSAICCSHYDAFRFFAPGARRFNRLQPGKPDRNKNEQCGCLHTNMDLYKWAAQSMPWVGSDLLWRAFQCAAKARELDMQASPYDCSALGYEPVAIETAAGRQTYEARQRAIRDAAQPIRRDLIERLDNVLGYRNQTAS